LPNLADVYTKILNKLIAKVATDEYNANCLLPFPFTKK
jgi:hypothetical protein